MNAKRRIVCLIVGAACALSASAASATEFHIAAVPATLTGVQTTQHRITLNEPGSTIYCKTKYNLKGVTSLKTTKTLTFVTEEENCIVLGFLKVPIHKNGCAYVLSSNGTSELECPSGKKVEYTIHPECLVTIGPQHIASGNSFSSNPGKTDFTTTSNTTGITYNECGTAGANGKTTGTITVTGATEGGAPVNVWYE